MKDNFYVAHLYAFGNPEDIVHGNVGESGSSENLRKMKVSKNSRDIVNVAGSYLRYHERPKIVGVFRSVILHPHLSRKELENMTLKYQIFPSEGVHPDLVRVGYNPFYMDKYTIENFLDLSSGRSRNDISRIVVAPHRSLADIEEKEKGYFAALESALDGNSDEVCRILEEVKGFSGLSESQVDLYDSLMRRRDSEVK